MAGGVLIALCSGVAWKRRGSGGGYGDDIRRFLDAPLQTAAALLFAFRYGTPMSGSYSSSRKSTP